MPRYRILFGKLILRIIPAVAIPATVISAYGQTDPVIYVRHILAPDPDPADVRSDLDLYHSRIDSNRYDGTLQVRHRLMHTVSLDILIAAYCEKGFGVVYDTLSVFDLFDVDRTVFSRQEQKDILERIYAANKNIRHKPLELFADHMAARLMDDSGQFDRRIECFENVIGKAERFGDCNWVAYTTREVWFNHFYSERYARSFAWLKRLEDALERVDESYPYKGLEMVWPGIAHYRFHDFDDAVPAFRRALRCRRPQDAVLGGNYLRAWSYLAAYHHERGELDSAAFYNRTILSSFEATRSYRQHLDFAVCNLGRIEMQKGNYDGAIALMEAGLKYIEKDPRSFDFLCGVYVSLGDCYLAKGDIQAASFYIEKAERTVPGTNLRNGYNRMRALYALKSSYYSVTGNSRRASIYLDSALVATSRYERLTSGRQILLGEQELQEAELLLTNQRVGQQKIIIRFLVAGAGTILCALLVFLWLYRRTQAAYRALAVKAGHWANSPKSMPDATLTEDELCMAENLSLLMDAHVPYTDPDLDLDSLAGMTGMSRNKLSRIINRSFGVNFNQFINDYRVKYAIRLLSDPQYAKLSTEQIMERAGFSSRTAFYVIFKQSTGLTPVQYRKASSGSIDGKTAAAGR
ncbi:MAG: helix-turn-helix domain-containing protein [Rikenellaceae bacterium]|nr:helix-turn-helix domain-containing protein [Rikenellaceae bacterium]